MGIRIITDSASDFDPAAARRRGVDIVSMSIQFGGDSFLAGFMHGVMTGKSIPECQKEGADLSAKIVAMFDPY